MHAAESRAWLDKYNYRDSLQTRALEGIGNFYSFSDKYFVKNTLLHVYNSKGAGQ